MYSQSSIIKVGDLESDEIIPPNVTQIIDHNNLLDPYIGFWEGRDKEGDNYYFSIEKKTINDKWLTYRDLYRDVLILRYKIDYNNGHRNTEQLLDVPFINNRANRIPIGKGFALDNSYRMYCTGKNYDCGQLVEISLSINPNGKLVFKLFSWNDLYNPKTCDGLKKEIFPVNQEILFEKVDTINPDNDGW